MARRPAALLLLAALLMPALLAPAPARAQGVRNPSFNLVNNADAPLREFFATPAGRENWGQNRLGGRTVAPGARFEVRLAADGNCIYDMRAVFADGRSEVKRQVDTCNVEDIALGAPGARSAARSGPVGGETHDPSFRLVNRGRSPIAEVFATAPRGAAHPDNLLADGATLPPQGTRMFTLPPGGGCSYDLRVVFADKQSREKKGVDLCKTGDLPVQ